MITWLLGKNINVDLIWQNYENEIIKNLNLVQNINLFEEKKYKYIYDKKDSFFFKNRKREIQSELIVKGVSKIDKDIMHDNDIIIDIDSQNDKFLFQFLIKLTKISFIQEELFFISKLTNLNDLSTIISLKKLEINHTHWNYFLQKEQQNWFKMLKENILLKEGVFFPNKIIPIMIYAINAKVTQKATLLFIQSKIKQGSQIWQLTKFWESCFKSLPNI
ncbi:hypothetical protein [Alphaproteobacteria bacterium endosymbiont of Tiliacea citrago]|uniref:hypothetical protein n=1 Tax=Alphaproteobacteria bacterium endosymbiont of Tiliacea citrago TaxID=3077944 RepID=UPI00313B591D